MDSSVARTALSACHFHTFVLAEEGLEKREKKRNRKPIAETRLMACGCRIIRSIAANKNAKGKGRGAPPRLGLRLHAPHAPPARGALPQAVQEAAAVLPRLLEPVARDSTVDGVTEHHKEFKGRKIWMRRRPGPHAR